MVACFLFYYARWEVQATSGGDSWGYYTYLPATFIHGDILTLDTVLAIRAKNFPNAVRRTENGKIDVYEASIVENHRVIKYTYGLSVFYVPSFFLSHVYALVSPDYEANGYSRIYIFGLYMMTVLYVLLGLFLLAKLLLRYYDTRTTILSLTIILFGTNLFYFTVFNNVMSHPILFFLWAVLLYTTDFYYKKSTLKGFSLIAFCVGMITIIRPAEMFCVLVPVLYQASNWAAIKARYEHFMQHLPHVFVAIGIGLLTIAPQLIYWQLTSGALFYDSYPGEGFDFANPKIYRGLFGFMNGWLSYSPLMIMCLPGFYFLFKDKNRNMALFAFIFVVHVYIIYSWWNWYYINGFGSRPMVDLYAMLAFPLAACLAFLLKKGKNYLLYAVVTVLIALNIFQVYQHNLGIMWTEMANWGYYRQAFGKTSFDQKMSVALDLNEYQHDEMTAIKTVYQETFEDTTFTYTSPEIQHQGQQSYRITRKTKEDFNIKMIYEDLLSDRGKEAQYLNVQFWVYVKRQAGGFYQFDTMIFDFEKPDNSVYRRRYLRLNNKPGDLGDFSIWWGTPNKWYPVEAQIRVPTRFKKGDHIRLFFNKEIDSCEVYVDDIEISTAE